MMANNEYCKVCQCLNLVLPIKKKNRQNIALYEKEYKCWPPPLGIIMISLLELMVFLIDHSKMTPKSKPMAQIFMYHPFKKYQIWRFLTYMFVHSNYLHLLFNMMVQICIGIPLEMIHNWWRVLLIYFAGVIAGSLSGSITNPMKTLVGASGGCCSLIGAHISAVILNWKEMSIPGIQLLLFLSITCIDIGNFIYNQYNNVNHDNISYAAHLAGTVAGLLVGFSVLRNLKNTKRTAVIWWVATAIYLSLMITAVFWNIFSEECV